MTKTEHALRSIYEADSRQEELEAWERWERLRNDSEGGIMAYDDETRTICSRIPN